MKKHSLHGVQSIFAAACTLAVLMAWGSCTPSPKASKLKFAVSFPAERSKAPLDGRVLLLVSNDGAAEPRFQISDGATTELIFGVDVDGLAPGQEALVDASAFGYPLPSIADLPAGEYFVQALLNRYETFHRADGHAVKLPPDKGEGQRWNAKPGNFYSAPVKMKIDPNSGETIRLAMDKEIPADSRAPGHQVHKAHQDPERSADQILGHANVPRRLCPASRRLR